MDEKPGVEKNPALSLQQPILLGYLGCGFLARGNFIGGFAGFLLISNLPKSVGWQIIFTGYALSAAVGAWLGCKKVSETRPTQTSQADGERTRIARYSVADHFLDS